MEIKEFLELSCLSMEEYSAACDMIMTTYNSCAIGSEFAHRLMELSDANRAVNRMVTAIAASTLLTQLIVPVTPEVSGSVH